MNAVNLIPADQRRGPGTSGSWGTYALLGGLVLVLLAVTAYVVTANQISQRQDDLAKATQRNQAATAQVSALSPYVQFAQLEQSRLETVHSIAASRFDWERAMSGLAHVTTPSVWLTAMYGTVTPDVQVDSSGASSSAGATDTSSLREDEPVPAVELSGCATTNRAVVAYLTRMRGMRGVTRVSFSDAQKPDIEASGGTTTTSASTGSSSGDCGTDPHRPAFHAVVFYKAPAALPTTATGTSATGAGTAASDSATTSAPSGGTG